MLASLLPWSLSGIGPFLSAYGDPVLFRSIRRTPPLESNPDADTGIHSAVPHRYLYAYLFAVKSFLRYHSDIAVFVHDDGSLRPEDKALIRDHVRGVRIIDRAVADKRFENEVGDPFLSRVRGSYTSYLKLFDPTLFSGRKRIVILDTDTLFLRRPDAVIRWVDKGGLPWYHCAPPGPMARPGSAASSRAPSRNPHIQTLVTDDLDEINRQLGTNYEMEQGFCSGFIGYELGTIRFDELKALFALLHSRFGDRIFKWGAEQTVHGLILRGREAHALPVDDYMVFTQYNADLAGRATFVHFVGANRFFRMRYPRLASRVVNELAGRAARPREN